MKEEEEGEGGVEGRKERREETGGRKDVDAKTTQNKERKRGLERVREKGGKKKKEEIELKKRMGREEGKAGGRRGETELLEKEKRKKNEEGERKRREGN